MSLRRTRQLARLAVISAALLPPLGRACPVGGCEGFADASGLQREAGQVASIRVFLDEQRLELLIDGKTVFCTPVSTGRRPGWTPLGDFTILSKHPRHRSSAYGKLVNGSGKTIKRDVDSRKTKPPKGARFLGAPMPNFLRMTRGGIGIHAGELPGHPSSKGCIRVSRDASEILFRQCREGDIVSVLQNRDKTNGVD